MTAGRPRAEQPGPVASAVLGLDLWLVSWGLQPPPATVLAAILRCAPQAVRQARARWSPWGMGQIARLEFAAATVAELRSLDTMSQIDAVVDEYEEAKALAGVDR